MQAEEEQLATGDSAVNDGDSTRAEVVNELRVEVEGDVPPLAATEAEAAADAMPPTEPTEAEAVDAMPPTEPTEVEAAGNAVLPTLGKDMTSAELRTYLTEFTTSVGVKIFDTAAVDQLEFYPMETLYSCANSSGKWQNVVDRLFDGDLATAQLFQAKVLAAKVSETNAARHAASKLGKAEKKAARLAELRAGDEKGPEPEQAPAPVRTMDPTATMMAAARDAPTDQPVFDHTCAALVVRTCGQTLTAALRGRLHSRAHTRTAHAHDVRPLAGA